ncbi:packaged DNA stabilization protein gp10 [Aestuariibacter halophilus]|uniref:Packaged DNA stabilization protein gp10 n=1 Tax=Fluctibacter halophilus TaxID=226011 RepID=A0ABS8G614_9ALTE|nr:packaged DNA stabilization protein gp10 [Aestuariibacter halophilus]MCC2615934.1 packaged DNA stabilization protein gp10 [Aestuariibacter halophilus]
MYQSFPVNITGPTYKSRSRPLASQVTRNLYQQVDAGGKENYTLMPFPGLLPVSNVTGIDRGLTMMKGKRYRVSGTALYRVDGVNNVKLGSIPGSERCIFANDGLNLFINTHGKVYWYDGEKVVLVNDADIQNVLSIDFINNQFLFTSKDLTTVSAVGDGSTASGLDAIGAETNPDELVRDFVFHQRIFRCSKKTIEQWYNSGVGQPPIEILDGQIIEVGLGARFSIAKDADHFYFVGHDRHIYKANTAGSKDITSPGIITALEEMPTIDDAIGYCLKIQRQRFYIITFPSGNKTLAVNTDLEENGWFELSYGLDGGVFNATSACYCEGINYLADSTNGNLYKLDLDCYEYDSTAIQRRRVTSSINAVLFGKQHRGKKVRMSSMRFVIETGTGLIQGNENPRIQVESSIDGGKSWAHETWLEIGRLGITSQEVQWDSMKVFGDMMVRLTFTEPCPIFLYSASIDLRLVAK